MQILRNASLQEINTFGIEANCQALATFSTAEELKEILQNSDFQHLPKLILGGGSNLLFTKNFEGLVLKNEIAGIELVGEDKHHYKVKVGAGENWNDFVQYCIANNWAGLENLSLIPGNVGASPMQNIGAYGVEIKDRFAELEAFNLERLEVETFDGTACQFGYRESVFKKELKGKYIILNVTFNLLKTPDFSIHYGAIQDELDAMGVEKLTIKNIGQAVTNIRNSKLPNPKDLGNAGSFFKNPVIDQKSWEKISKAHPEIPNYPAGEGQVKLAAGWLIEQAGFKGVRNGNCGMHAKQALVLVNYGGATGDEIYAHSSLVQKGVFEKFGVKLEREVNII